MGPPDCPAASLATVGGPAGSAGRPDAGLLDRDGIVGEPGSPMSSPPRLVAYQRALVQGSIWSYGRCRRCPRPSRRAAARAARRRRHRWRYRPGIRPRRRTVFGELVVTGERAARRVSACTVRLLARVPTAGPAGDHPGGRGGMPGLVLVDLCACPGVVGLLMLGTVASVWRRRVRRTRNHEVGSRPNR
jgi:hypothetical protein